MNADVLPMNAPKARVLIKYRNRRLYDKGWGIRKAGHLKYENVHDIVFSAVDTIIVVQKYKTGEDITHEVMLDVLVDAEKRRRKEGRAPLLPLTKVIELLKVR